MSEREILDDFPELTSEAIRAYLSFAVDGERRQMSIPALYSSLIRISLFVLHERSAISPESAAHAFVMRLR